MSSSIRSRAYCFTYNNYTEEDLQKLLNYSLANYVIIGREIAPTTGTPHLQGYMRFTNAIRFVSLVKAFPGVHFEVAKGTFEQNVNYCCKENNFVERGERPSTDGYLSGMLNIVDEAHDRMNEIDHYGVINDVNIALCDIGAMLQDYIEEIEGLYPESPHESEPDGEPMVFDIDMTPTRKRKRI